MTASTHTTLPVGTRKGLFILRSDDGRPLSDHQSRRIAPGRCHDGAEPRSDHRRQRITDPPLTSRAVPVTLSARTR